MDRSSTGDHGCTTVTCFVSLFLQDSEEECWFHYTDKNPLSLTGKTGLFDHPIGHV
jgi:hypothetical protein